MLIFDELNVYKDKVVRVWLHKKLVTPFTITLINR